MKPRYRFEFVDEIATADAAFRASGDDLGQLFAACAAALFETIVALDSIVPRRTLTLELAAADRERLLYGWLSELVYLKDTRRELYSEFAAHIVQQGDEMILRAEIKGESFDATRHAAGADVKAVTYHRLEIRETDRGFEALVVLDL
ncbi:MAG: archease [bacterium]